MHKNLLRISAVLFLFAVVASVHAQQNPYAPPTVPKGPSSQASSIGVPPRGNSLGVTVGQTTPPSSVKPSLPRNGSSQATKPGGQGSTRSVPRDGMTIGQSSGRSFSSDHFSSEAWTHKERSVIPRNVFGAHIHNVLAHTFTRGNFGYTTPITPSLITPSWQSPFFINALIALLTVVLLILTRLLLDILLPIAPKGVLLFLRRLPLSLVIFLALMFLRELVLPHAYAQDGSTGLPSPGLWVVLYSIGFFVVAGITNFICNNMLTSEAETLERMFLPVRAVSEKGGSHQWKRSIPFLVLFFLAYSVIGAHINTSFSVLPLSQPGIALVAFITILVAAYSKDGFRFLFAKRLRWQPWLEANAIGILLALLSVWLTRSLGLSPGYLFGVPAGVVIAVRQYEKREGPFEWFGLITMLIVAGITYLLLPAVAGIQVIHDFFNLLIVILLEACFFESLPFAYLSGGSVYRWRRMAWALQMFVTTFLVLQLLWNPSGTLYSLKASPPSMTYLALLGVYAVVVVALYLYCKAKKAKN